MSDTRIGSGRPGGGSGIDLLKGLGLGERAKVAPVSPIQAAQRQPAGQRMLAPDTPLDDLDRNARRGTYLDILV